MAEYLKGFGYYRDYEERVLYLAGASDKLLSYMLDYVLKNGAISKKSGDAYITAREEYSMGSNTYTAIRFTLGDGSVHPTVLYMKSASVSRVCSMCVRVKKQLGV